MDFQKIIYKNVKKKKKRITANVSIYMGHRHFEVL